MLIPPERLTTKALLALEEAAGLADKGPVKPTLAVRFALAFLYANGKGGRDPYDTLWTVLSANGDSNPENIQRTAMAFGALEAIYRDVGRQRTREMMFYSVKRNRVATNGDC